MTNAAVSKNTRSASNESDSYLAYYNIVNKVCAINTHKTRAAIGADPSIHARQTLVFPFLSIIASIA